MLVNVITMLEVAVAIVNVVDVVVVFHGLAAVTLSVGAFVLGVDVSLAVVLVAVNVVDVTVVLDGLAAVAGQVLVVGDLNVAHGYSLRFLGLARSIWVAPQRCATA